MKRLLLVGTAALALAHPARANDWAPVAGGVAAGIITGIIAAQAAAAAQRPRIIYVPVVRERTRRVVIHDRLPPHRLTHSQSHAIAGRPAASKAHPML
jgi:hypothetical protein